MDAPSWPPAKPCSKSAVHGMLTSAWAMYLLELRRGGNSGPPRSEEVHVLWPELQPLTHPRIPYSSYTPLGCFIPSTPCDPLLLYTPLG